MNDYGEILKLPYNTNDIYEPLKKLLKYDKIKPMILQKEDEKNKTFNLTAKRKLIFNEKINIKITELEKGITEVRVYSKSRLFVPFDFGKNKRNVKIIIDTILKELSNSENTDDNFSIDIMKTTKFLKSLLHFIISLIVFYYLFSCFFALIHIIDNMKAEAAITMVITFALFTTIIYKIIRPIKRKRYKYKRISKIKSLLYDLIEKRVNKADIDSQSKDIIEESKNNTLKKVKNELNPYFKKSINYIKKTKKEKPKVFWSFSVLIGGFLLWSIFGGLSNTLKDPCDFNVEMGGYVVTDIVFCRTDFTIRQNEIDAQIPSRFNVKPKDFIYCQYGTTDLSQGWAEGWIYKKCAIKMGWKQ